MSFLICYKKVDGKFLLETILNERTIPSPITYAKESSSMYVGECFGCSAEDIINCDWKNNPSILNSYMSAGYIISFDKDTCYYATDNTGRELLYYYYSDNYYMLSDSFWQIVKRIEPVLEDIDAYIVKEMIAMGGGVPCNHVTPVKGLLWAGPNILGVFNSQTGMASFDRYENIRRTGKIKNISIAVKQMDEAMKQMAKWLSEEFPNKTFGLGLSGGLDSRVALHYMQYCNNPLKCFNVCTARPRKILLAQSVKNARVLARAKNADYCEVEWHVNQLREKFDRMLEFQPLGTAGHFTNAYKYENDGMPEFDVLITAGQGIGPYLVGVSAVDNSDILSREQIFDYLMNLEIENAPAYTFVMQAIRRILSESGLKYIDTKRGKGYKYWEKYADVDTYERIKSKVNDFIDSRLANGYRPADITLDFRTSTLGAIGRNGAYESVLGTYRNFTIYTPFLVNIGLDWDISIIENRKILKELIKQKMPEFSDVGEEEAGAANFNSPIKRFIKRFEFLIRGSGIKADEWYSNHKEVKLAFFEDFNNGCKWFDKLMNIKSNPDNIWKLSPGRKNSIWELKRLIDCIETKRYMNFNN